MSIKYHGTPISGNEIDIGRFLRQRHALINYFHQQDLGIALKVCTTVIFDTGAFTLWNSQKAQTYDAHYAGYVEWVRAYYRHPRFAWCIIPDVIAGSETQNDAYLEQWPEDLKHVGVPVWHLNESLERLYRLATSYPRIALAQGPYSGNLTERLNQTMEAVCDSEGQPLCKLHGLKLQDPSIFQFYPFSSTDSTNVAQNNAREFAKGKQPTRAQCCDYIANKIEIFNSAPSFRRENVQQATLLF